MLRLHVCQAWLGTIVFTDMLRRKLASTGPATANKLTGALQFSSMLFIGIVWLTPTHRRILDTGADSCLLFPRLGTMTIRIPGASEPYCTVFGGEVSEAIVWLERAVFRQTGRATNLLGQRLTLRSVSRAAGRNTCVRTS
jgi:hypothetical protein